MEVKKGFECPIKDPENIRMETNRLILRTLKEDDAEDVYRNVKEYDIAKWTINIPHPYPTDGAIKFIRSSTELMKKGQTYQFAILLKESSELVGVMSLIGVNMAHRNAELGYWVGKEFWNRGYATEASQRAIQFGFEELGMERICARCFFENRASKRVMEKSGMKFEGIFRHEVYKDTEFIDMVYYSTLRDEWEGTD